MNLDFWQKQDTKKPLFPDVEWSRPEQKSQSGNLAIMGGNKLGFMAISDAYSTAQKVGAGQVRAILPDVLKKNIPANMSEVIFLKSNNSGGFSKENSDELLRTVAWADAVLLAGDMGKNSETAMLCEELSSRYSEQLIVARDSFDLIKPALKTLIERPKTTFVLSFAQMQKLFQGVYYPRILSFSMQIMQLVDALHKFTITYPITIITFHQNQLIVAHDGQIVSQDFDQPMLMWRGVVATNASVHLMWGAQKPLEQIACSFLSI